MARPTFSNQQLVLAWRKQAIAEPRGSRRDVVTDLMGQLGIEDTKENRKRVYNNVTQRLRQLSNHKTNPITFLELEPGKKGAPRTAETMEDLQKLMNGEPTESEADAPSA